MARFEIRSRAIPYEQEATLRKLVRKGLLPNEEILEEIKAVRRELKGKLRRWEGRFLLARSLHRFFGANMTEGAKHMTPGKELTQWYMCKVCGVIFELADSEVSPVVEVSDESPAETDNVFSYEHGDCGSTLVHAFHGFGGAKTVRKGKNGKGVTA